MQTDHSLSPLDRYRLSQLLESLQGESQNFIGYPCNSQFDYSPLFPFLSLPLNNLGDPFAPSNYHINTHEMEREVIRFFQELTQAPTDSTWGYVTNGGTEGNLYGIFLARELLGDCMVYFSEDTHYSVTKILRCLHVRNIMIKSKPDGGMDLEDLYETVRIHRDVPPIIFVNIGTTMKGAIDDLAGINQILSDLAIQRHYIHADAALSGMILPFVANPPPWDFAAGIDSISISGHKMIGSPIPCGVVLAKKSHVDRIARGVEYVGTLDTTIMGSRNGITPLFLWYAMKLLGREGFQQTVAGCLQVADYALEKLRQVNRNPWTNPHSITVVFDRPGEEITSRWQLASQNKISHLIAMPHVKKEQIDRLADDLKVK
ncbi:MAG: histidine decarboxylase [Gemmataceae bacterium]|nr:histidine decarboxylase [Gemmataceae bacterium]